MTSRVLGILLMGMIGFSAVAQTEAVDRPELPVVRLDQIEIATPVPASDQGLKPCPEAVSPDLQFSMQRMLAHNAGGCLSPLRSTAGKDTVERIR